MKLDSIIVIALAALLAFSCGKPSADSEHHEEVRQQAHQPLEAKGNVLEVEETMLRDLRITTTTVVTCECGEGVSAVGEIQTDPARYAEVGIPVTARVRPSRRGPGTDRSRRCRSRGGAERGPRPRTSRL